MTSWIESVHTPEQTAMIEIMKFVCRISERDGTWTVEHTSQDVGPIRVYAPTRSEATRKTSISGFFKVNLHLEYFISSYQDMLIICLQPSFHALKFLPPSLVWVDR